MRIAVTCGYPKSLHTIALLHQLAARGHQVVLCLRVRVLDYKRLRMYLRQLGWRKALTRARQKLGRQARVAAEAPGELAPMLEYLDEHGIASRSVGAACAAVGAREVVAASLNDAEVVQTVRAEKIDLIVYSGGGILRKPIIEAPARGVLNAHGGALPAFRGMNASEWSMLYGVRPVVTFHLIDTGIDTGPILFERPMPTDDWRGVPHMRGLGTRVGVEGLLDAVDMLAADKVQPRPQRREDGRQFFVMAAPLLEVLERRMAEGRTTLRDAAELSYPALPGLARS